MARPSIPWRVLQWAMWGLVILAMAATIAAGALVAFHLAWHRTPDKVMRWLWPGWLLGAIYGYHQPSKTSLSIIAAVWIAAVAVSHVIRSFIVEYVGDVAIYVASHKLDRFYETRKTIKELSLRLVQAIYEHGGYGRHICVGHSLGSVVAYDTLNRLLNESYLNPGLNVLPRTQLLLTMGSPLDKTAFLFRAQSEFSDVREAMAAATQPMIVSYTERPAWVNIYSRNDPIGSSLEYYDPPPGHRPANARPIVNIKDDQSWIPLVAHNQYWTNDAFVTHLRNAIAVGR